MKVPRRMRRGPRPLHKRTRRALKTWIAQLAGRLVPPLYRGYLHFVWATSRVVDHGCSAVAGQARERGALVVLCWHEEVFWAPYAYARMGMRLYTLVNQSDSGEVIAPFVASLGHRVARGGTSRRSSRHRPTVLRGAIAHLRERRGGIFGVLVDGSNGPRYHIKPGALLVAREAGCPVTLLRSWCRRCLRLDTWDRAAIPLPFNEIHVYAQGPYDPPPREAARAGLDRFREQLEKEFVELTARSYRETGHEPPPELLATMSASG